MKRRDDPPPVLDGFRVVEFAATSRPVKFAGRTHFFVGDKEMGQVPRLAIGEWLERKEFAILHLTRSWRVLGVQGGYRSVSAAKLRAERIYPGISPKWIKTAVSKAEARKYYRKQWESFACSFCGKTPPETKSGLVQSRRTKAIICQLCVRAFGEGFAKP